MLIGRLIRVVVVLALLIGALLVLVSLVVQPFVEHQAADAIGKQLGTKVTVDAGESRRNAERQYEELVAC